MKLQTGAVVLSLLLLTACVPNQTALVIDSACNTASAVVKVLTVQKAQGKLSDQQIVDVTKAVNIVDPICGAETRPTDVEALAKLDNALLTLQGVEGVE